MTNNDQINALKALFIEENIPRALWFSKYSYFKVYDETRYKLSFFLQIISFILYFFTFNIIIRTMFFDGSEMYNRIIFFLCIGAGISSASEFLGGNHSLGVKWLLIVTCFFYFM
jgi:hypothetical protein